jgi:hypothetical protein
MRHLTPEEQHVLADALSASARVIKPIRPIACLTVAPAADTARNGEAG